MIGPICALAAFLLIVTNAQGKSTGRHETCAILKSQFTNITFFANSSGYISETQGEYWSKNTWKSAACVFVPKDPEQVAAAVKLMSLTRSRFAVRSGGHMPIPGYNGIDGDGILISTSDLNHLSLSQDGSVVSIGAGNRWRDVYNFLAPYGLAAAGGRVGGVGVSGFTLGGGISFYSSQFGFGADNVVRFQCVLSSGAIVEATGSNDFADLYWALKGGGNSLAIITRFDYRNIKSPSVYVGISQYPETLAQSYLDAVYHFGKDALQVSKAAIIPTIVRLPSSNVTAYAAARFYDSDIDHPRVFENFTAPRLVPIVDGYAKQPLAEYITATDALQPTGLRQVFRTVSMTVNQNGVSQVHDSFLRIVNARLSGVASLTASITLQPISKNFILQGRKNGGNPQGVDLNKAPYFWIVANWSWTDETDDALVASVADQTVGELEMVLRNSGILATYSYLNDAGKGQEIFQGYDSSNVARLKQIRSKYDPSQILTDLMPGGWKISYA